MSSSGSPGIWSVFKTLGQEVTYLEGLFRQGAAYLVHNDGWTGQPWASSLPSSP
jgi:hypothetical protein